MPTRPRAVVSIDLRCAGRDRTVILTVPTLIDFLVPGERAYAPVEHRILAEAQRILEELGAALGYEAIVLVERVDEHIAWCRLTDAGGRFTGE
jgi:hypothetical protein